MRHDIESCDQGGEDQDKTWLDGPIVSIKDARQSTEGYPTMVDLSVGVRIIRNRMVTQGAETTILIGSGRLIDIIPYVLCLWCIVLNMRCRDLSTRGPLPLLIYSGGVGLQGKYPIWYYTIAYDAR